MPVVHKYVNQSGRYIRANIDATPVTFQVTEAANGLLGELGYNDDDEIAWGLVYPLIDAGQLYTNRSGADGDFEPVDLTSIADAGLSQTEQNRLQEFLEQTQRTTLDKTTSTAVRDSVDDDVVRLLQEWLPDDDAASQTIDRLCRADDPGGICDSIRHHGRTPTPDRFHISSRGIPVYGYELLDVAWAVHDYRLLDTPGIESQLYYVLQPGTKAQQSVSVLSDTVEWHTQRERFSEEQIATLMLVGPSMLTHYHDLKAPKPSKPAELPANATATLPDGAAERVVALDNMGGVQVEDSDRLYGAICTATPSGYGYVYAHTGDVFFFSCQDLDSAPKPGTPLSFTLKAGFQAVELQREDELFDGETLLRQWPALQDVPLDNVRAAGGLPIDNTSSDHNTSTDVDEPEITLPTNLTLGDSEVATDSRVVSLDALLLVHLKLGPDETAVVVSEALQTTLTDAIDGAIPSPVTPAGTIQVEIEASPQALKMLDSVVASTPQFETISGVLNAAIHATVAPHSEQFTVDIETPAARAIETLPTEQRKQLNAELRRTAVSFVSEYVESANQ